MLLRKAFASLFGLRAELQSNEISLAAIGGGANVFRLPMNARGQKTSSEKQMNPLHARLPTEDVLQDYVTDKPEDHYGGNNASYLLPASLGNISRYSDHIYQPNPVLPRFTL
jgi:hypothetical protein